MTLPEVAVVGTIAPTAVFDQDVTVAATPLNVTVLVPCVAPKLVPATKTLVPVGPKDGDIFDIPGETVKGTDGSAEPVIVTTTFPVVAPLGTGTTIWVPLQLLGAAVMPLNVTVLVP